jgi:hypothetical protein
MNERIRELAFQSAGGMLSYDAEGSFRLSEQEVEKFAELLVKECIGIVADAVDHREPARTYVGKIKQHFGVEE